MHRVRLKNEYTSNHNKKETELIRQERNGVNVMKKLISTRPYNSLTTEQKISLAKSRKRLKKSLKRFKRRVTPT